MTSEDEAVVDEIVSASFATPLGDASSWLDRAGREHVRVWREDGVAQGTLLLIPMGQFFGGRSVSTMGIAGVGVAIDKRQQKVAQRMMQATLEEAREQGFCLSTLYPATQTLYRSVGYERAGKLVEYELCTSRLETDAAFEPLEARSLGPDDHEATRALYSEVAHEQSGYLDRGAYIWDRVRSPRKSHCRGVGFFDGDALVAYTHFVQEPDSHGHGYDARVTDFVAKSARGYAALFCFYRGQRSLLENIKLKAGPSAPFLSLLREPRPDESAPIDWMIRVLDVKRAFEARGYPRGLRASVTLDVRDETLPGNAGAWRLSVSDGAAEVTRAQRADASLDARALAAMYAGYMPATVARRLEWLRASAEDAATLDAMLSGPMPAMSEMF